jgi:hypothetical protein
MRKVITIDIPKPCHENWDMMTPEARGRHCAFCEKTVFDFTSKTDEYIAKIFHQNKNLCGRFKSTQLKRELVFSRKVKNNYASFLASGFLAVLGLSSQDVPAQGKPHVVQVDTLNSFHSLKGKVLPIVKKDIVKGVIRDEDKLPLPGATILIKGTSIGTTTDFDGNFSIEAKKGDTLILSYLGYETKEIAIGENLNQTIMLKMEAIVLGGIGYITVGGAVSKNSYVYSHEESLERENLNELRKKNNSTFYKRIYKEQRAKIKNSEIPRSKVGLVLFKFTNVFRAKK